MHSTLHCRESFDIATGHHLSRKGCVPRPTRTIHNHE